MNLFRIFSYINFLIPEFPALCWRHNLLVTELSGVQCNGKCDFKLPSRYALGQFVITRPITPRIVLHTVLLLWHSKTYVSLLLVWLVFQLLMVWEVAEQHYQTQVWEKLNRLEKHKVLKGFFFRPPLWYIDSWKLRSTKTYFEMASKHFCKWGWTACGLRVCDKISNNSSFERK